MCMTENQIQNAASDDPGDWSPEVRFLAREVERLRAAIADTVKMAETPSKDQHIRKLEEDIKDLVSRCRRAENRAEYAEGRLRIAEADLKVLRDMSPSDHAMAREARLNHQITALTVRAEKAESEATILRGLWAADSVACQEVYAAARSVVRAWTHEGWSEGGQEQMARLAKAVGL